MAPAQFDSCDWPEVEEVVGSSASPAEDRRRRLLEAVRHGDSLELRALVRRGAPLLTRCPELPELHNANLIDWALHYDKPDMALRLLKMADSVGLGEELACSTVSAVKEAARQGHSELLNGLLTRNAPFNGGLRDEDDSALVMAAVRGHVSCVRALVAAGAWLTEGRKEEVMKCAKLDNFVGVLPAAEARDVREKNQRELRSELEEAILAGDAEGVAAAVRAGASLMPQYHCSKAAPHSEQSLAARAESVLLPESGTSAASTSTPRAALVNPADFAALSCCPKIALRLLELGDELLDKTSQFAASGVHAPDEVLAVGCRHAVHVSAFRSAAPRWLSLAWIDGQRCRLCSS